MWPAILGAAVSLIGGSQANSANSYQNRAAREFARDMSSTEVQRRAADLEAAGFNRILAAGGEGASSPTPSQIPMKDVGSEAVGRAVEAFSAKTASKVAEAQVGSMNAASAASVAAARKSNAEAAIIEASAPGTTAETVSAQVAHVNAQIAEIGARINQIAESTRGQQLSNRQVEQLMPFVVQLKKLEVKSADLGIPEKEARAQIARAVGKGISLYEKLPTTKLGQWLGGKAADLRESLPNMWERLKERDRAARRK